MAPAVCAVCDRAAVAGTLRCACGALFLDEVEQLRAEDAESLMESSFAATDADIARGRRMLGQAVVVGFVPVLIAAVCVMFGDWPMVAGFGGIGLASGAWGARGLGKIRTARRIAAANRVALPPARIRG